MNGSMHCDDVTRELATPTGGSDPEALADHLASCPGCARFATDVARLDQIWDATRPAEPSDATWNILWADVSARLVEAAAPVPVPVPATVRKVVAAAPVAKHIPLPRRGLWVFGLAQAAALFVGFGLLLARSPAPVSAAVPVVEIEQGQVVIIHGDGQVELRDPDAATASSTTLDDNYAILNAFEAMANL